MDRKHDNDEGRQLREIGSTLICVMQELLSHLKQNQTPLILNRMAQMEERIMSQISDYAGRVNTAFDAIGTSVDAIVSAQTGIAGDVTELKRIILELQTNPGPISPEDQALLDALEVKITGLVDKTFAVAEALKALDAQTETVPPVTP